MTHGLRIVNNGNRYGENLLDGIDPIVQAVLEDWYFGTSGTTLTAAGIASAFAAGVAIIGLALVANGLGGAEALGQPAVSVATNLTNAGNIASGEAFGGGGGGSITQHGIAATNDDATQEDTTAILLDGATIWNGYFNHERRAGFRWQTIDIPQGATIDSAVVQLYYSNVSGTVTDVHLKIVGDDVDNAGEWGTSADLWSVTPTAAQVDWDPQSWPAGYNTLPDIKSVIQEIVGRPGWSANNNLRIAIINDGTVGNAAIGIKDWSDWEYGVNTALLDVTYSTGGPGGSISQTVSANGIATSGTNGVPAVSPTVTPAGLAGSEAFGQPSVSTATNLTNAGNIAGAEAFGQPGLASNLSASGIATGAAYGSPSAIEAVSATGVGTGAAYGQPGVSQTVTPTAIDTGAAYGTPALAQTITASAISGLEAFGTATIQETTEAWVYPVAIASGEAIGQHGLAAVLSPSGFAPTPAFGSPTVSETFDVTANGIDGTETFGTATVTRDYILTRVARNAAKQPIVGADVFLFDTYTKTLQGTTTTDSSGRWTFHVSGAATCYFAVMFYGNLAGVTLNTLVGA